MTTVAIRKKLVDYMQTADDKKVKAIYTLLKNDLQNNELVYSDELKKQLDEGYSYYKNGGKMISAKEANKQIRQLLQSKNK